MACHVLVPSFRNVVRFSFRNSLSGTITDNWFSYVDATWRQQFLILIPLYPRQVLSVYVKDLTNSLKT